VDGGLVNPVPVSACRALGAHAVIAVNLNSEFLAPRRNVKRRRSEPRIAESEVSESLEKLVKNVPHGLGAGFKKLLPDLFAPGDSAPGYVDVATSAINIMQDRITRSRLAGDPPDLALQPHVVHIGILEFHRAEEAIAAGRESVEAARPALDRLLR